MPSGERPVGRTRVVLGDPDPSWPQRFAAERRSLAASFDRFGVAADVMAVEHIGSTAVPGLAAKPVIDIMVGLQAWPASRRFVAAVEHVGYDHRGEAGVAGRHYFQSEDGAHTGHIHAVEHDGRFWRDHLLFRDALRRDPAARAAYAELKGRLAPRHPNDRAAYTEGKRDFVRAVLRRARSGESGVHAAAGGFDTDPERYERSRPRYPPAAVRFLLDHLALGPGRRVADLGAGTGKLTRPLVAAGAEVVAVEPVPAMRRHLAAALPEVRVWDATAEELPAPAGSFDALVAGQAFHWFDAHAALTEAYRVLRRGGGLALVWNVRDEAVPWVARWNELVDRVAKDAPRARERRWDTAVEATELFGQQEAKTFPNVHRVPREAVVERFASTSVVAALEDARREELLDEFRTVLEIDPATSGHTEIPIPYRTEVTVLEPQP